MREREPSDIPTDVQRLEQRVKVLERDAAQFAFRMGGFLAESLKRMEAVEARMQELEKRAGKFI